MTNYTPGVGNLVLNKEDFDKHVSGEDFRHEASQIDLDSPVDIVGKGTATQVQDAIKKLSEIAYPPEIPPSTNETAGIVVLNGDLTGSYNYPQVTGIWGRKISNEDPLSNEVLTWSGDNERWEPTPAGSITPDATTEQKGKILIAGDISGDAELITVVGIQQKPVSEDAPNPGDVLTFDGDEWSGKPLPEADSDNKGILQLSGDLSGTSDSPKVVKLQGYAVGDSEPEGGYFLIWSGTAWEPSSLTPADDETIGGVILKEDVAPGDDGGVKVVGIQGNHVSNEEVSNGNTLVYNTEDEEWQPKNLDGDVTGSITQNTVEKIRNLLIDPEIDPNNGELLAWDYENEQWIASSINSYNLDGDVTGSLSENTVERIRNLLIDPEIDPNEGDVLTWNDEDKQWIASPINSTFTPGGDLSGNSTEQYVSSISGEDGTADYVSVKPVLCPKDSQIGVLISATENTNEDILIQSFNPTESTRVLALVGENKLNDETLPLTTGDLVIFIGNAKTPPTESATGGAVLYSNDGDLFIQRENSEDAGIIEPTVDTKNYSIASGPNPRVRETYDLDSEGGSAQKNKHIKYSSSRIIGSSDERNLLEIQLPTANATVIIKAELIGRLKDEDGNTVWYSLDTGYTISSDGGINILSGAPSDFSIKYKYTSDFNFDTAPEVIAAEDKKYYIKSGAHNEETSYWTLNIDLYINYYQ